MSQQWLFKDNDQANKEFSQKARTLKIGILVLIDQVVYWFENEKEWKSCEQQLLKNSPSQYALTNLSVWHEWLRARG